MKNLIYTLAFIASTTVAMQESEIYLNTIPVMNLQKLVAQCQQENSIPIPSEIFPPQNIPEIIFNENTSLFFVHYFYKNPTKDTIVGIDIRTECDEKSITEPKAIQTALNLLKSLENLGKIKEDKIIVDNDPQMPSKHIIYTLPQHIPDIFCINLPSHLMIRCSHKARLVEFSSITDLTTKKYVLGWVTIYGQNRILEKHKLSFNDDPDVFIEHIRHYLEKDVLEFVKKEENKTTELQEELYTYRVKTQKNKNVQ